MEYKEIKFHDIDVDDGVVAANGTIAEDSILTIPQGDTSITRSGRQIFVKSIYWRYQIELPSSTDEASTSDTVRVIMYIDHQANGATATVANILATDNFQSFKNLHVGSRFSFIHDKTYQMNTMGMAGNGTANDSAEVKRGKTVYHAFKRHLRIMYNSTAGVITEMEQNNVGVLLLSLSGLCAFTSKVRVRFHD